MSSQLHESVDLKTSSSDPSTVNTPAASSSSSVPSMKIYDADHHSRPLVEFELKELFSGNVAAKIWRVARSHLEKEVSLFFFRVLVV